MLQTHTAQTLEVLRGPSPRCSMVAQRSLDGPISSQNRAARARPGDSFCGLLDGLRFAVRRPCPARHAQASGVYLAVSGRVRVLGADSLRGPAFRLEIHWPT